MEQDFGCKVFSVDQLPAFLVWFEDLKSQMPPEHRADLAWAYPGADFLRELIPRKTDGVGLRLPRVEERYFGVLKIGHISRNHGQLVVYGSRCEHRVNGRHELALPLHGACEYAPSVGYGVIHWQYSPGETVPQIDLQPQVQLCTALALGQRHYAFTDFTQGERA